MQGAGTIDLKEATILKLVKDFRHVDKIRFNFAECNVYVSDNVYLEIKAEGKGQTDHLVQHCSPSSKIAGRAQSVTRAPKNYANPNLSLLSSK